MQGRKIDPSELQRMATEGKGVRAIAREIGVNPSSVTKALQRLERKQRGLPPYPSPSGGNSQPEPVSSIALTRRLNRKLDLLREIKGDHGKLADAIRYIERRMETADDSLRQILEARFIRFLEMKGRTEDRYLETGRTFLSLIAEEEFRRILIQEIKAESPEVAKRVKERIDGLLAAQGLQ
jgi:transposase-like protein